MMINLIRVTGWLGVLINIIAISSHNLQLVLLGQLVSSVSAFLWSRFLQNKVTWDILLSLTFSIVSVITGEQMWIFAAMLSRSVSYQFVFERVVKERKLVVDTTK